MECGSLNPTGATSGALSACAYQCAAAVLDCSNTPALDMYDTTECNMEHALFGSNLCEFVDIAGFVVEFRALLHPNDDYLYGEDPNASLSEPALTKCVFEPTEESSVINAWGISFDDTMQYMEIPISMFQRDCGHLYNTTPELSAKAAVPKAGDVIKVLFNEKKYEITDVGKTGTNFNAKQFVYELILRPYRFSEQSAEHREFYSDYEEDPFETMVPGPSGDVPQKNYLNDEYGNNDDVEAESDTIDDYRDVINDPDKGAFGY